MQPCWALGLKERFGSARALLLLAMCTAPKSPRDVGGTKSWCSVSPCQAARAAWLPALGTSLAIPITRRCQLPERGTEQTLGGMAKLWVSQGQHTATLIHGGYGRWPCPGL